MTVREGDTFLGDPQALPGQTPHLWVVLAVYSSDLGDCVLAVMVNATSNPADQTCVVEPGDHPFFRQQSFIFYQRAGDFPVEEVEKMKRHVPASAELLARIRRGFHVSRFAPRRLKQIVPNK